MLAGMFLEFQVVSSRGHRLQVIIFILTRVSGYLSVARESTLRLGNYTRWDNFLDRGIDFQ